MVNNYYDILILGAGPAGLSAAVTINSPGLRALVIDYKQQDVGNGYPIESIHPGVIRQLEYLDMATDIEKCFRGKYSCISDGLKSKSLNPYTEEIWYGYHICKNTFNTLLCDNAERKGVHIKKVITKPIIERLVSRGYKVVVGAEQYSCKFIVDATGRKRAGQKNFKSIVTKYSPDCLVVSGVQIQFDKQLMDNESAYFLPYKNYWIWLGHLDDGRQCWTAVFKKRDWKAFKKEFLPIDLRTADRWTSITWEFASQLDIPGFLICGDAVSLLDPASGKGIYQAIESGVMAAKAVDDIFAYPSEERSIKFAYEAWMRGRFFLMVDQLKSSYEELGINLE